MTTLEARVAALEQDFVVLYAAIRHIQIGQSLFTSMSAVQLQTLIDQVRRLRDELDDGDEWKDFA